MLAAAGIDRWRRLTTSGLVVLLLALPTSCGGEDGGIVYVPEGDSGDDDSEDNDSEDNDSDGDDGDDSDGDDGDDDSDEAGDSTALDFDDGQQNAVQVADKAEVTGTATPGAIVTVDGRTGGATAGSDGRFRLVVALDVGENVLVVRATAPNRTATTRELRLFHEPTEDGEDPESSP